MATTSDSAPQKELIENKNLEVAVAHEDIQMPEMGRGAFTEIEKMRHVEVDDVTEQYDVTNFYKKTGWAQRVARDSRFENITLGVISLNALYFFFDTDYNMLKEGEKAHVFFEVMNQLFCVFFFGELLIRFLAFKRKRNCLRDGWFKFDFVLVFLMVADTWILKIIMAIIDDEESSNPLAKFSILRLLRLARLTRLVRLMSAFPELLTLLKGMVASVRSVGSTLFLLIIFLYVFAIAFTQLAFEGRDWVAEPATCYFVPNATTSTLVAECGEDSKPLDDMFGSMFKSMLALMLAGTLLDDITAVCDIFKECPQGYLMLVFFLLFVLISSFTVLNMLIGVLCEVVSATSEGETEKLMILQVKEVMGKVFSRIDADGSGRISKVEFEKMQEDPAILKAFDLLGVEPKHVMALSDSVFEEDDPDAVQSPAPDSADALAGGETSEFKMGDDGEALKEISFNEFLDLICHLRPGNEASVLDIAEVRKSIRNSTRKLERNIKKIQAHMGVPQSPSLSAAKSNPSMGGGSGVDAADIDRMINNALDKFASKMESKIEAAVAKALASQA